MSPYHLPGRRIAVERRSALPRAALDAVRTLALPSVRIAAAGRSGDRERLHTRLGTWARAAVRRLDIDLRVEGLEGVGPGPYVVAPLHESFADVVALLHLPLPLSFVARDELAEWAMLGRCLQDTGQIVVHPERPVAAARVLLRSARAAVSRGESVVVFPQGTILGVEIAFGRGADWLAGALGVPILPVVLAGGHRVWEWPYSPLVRYGEPLYMEAMDPVRAGELAGLAGVTRHRAIDNGHAPARRFVPDEDGYWDGYAYEVDPSFPDLAAAVARHRTRRGPSTPPMG